MIIEGATVNVGEEQTTEAHQRYKTRKLVIPHSDCGCCGENRNKKHKRFIEKGPIPSESEETLMNPEALVATAQDRPATSEEIRCAVSATPDCSPGLFYTRGSHYEIESEMGGRIRYPVEEFVFFAYLNDMKTADAN